MKTIIRFIMREYYKFPYYSSREQDAVHGKFRVLYKDGKRTHKMCYANAKNYAEIFNGKVIDAF